MNTPKGPHPRDLGHFGDPDSVAHERRLELEFADPIDPDPDDLVDPTGETEPAPARCKHSPEYFAGELCTRCGRAWGTFPGRLLGACPGERVCFTRAGRAPCRVHGCRVCGAPVLADTEDWPAPLCIAHAPEPLFSQLERLRAVLGQHVQGFDGVHNADCSVLAVFGQLVSDDRIAAEHARVKAELGGTPRSPCTCGATALREEGRAVLELRASPEKPS